MEENLPTNAAIATETLAAPEQDETQEIQEALRSIGQHCLVFASVSFALFLAVELSLNLILVLVPLFVVYFVRVTRVSILLSTISR